MSRAEEITLIVLVGAVVGAVGTYIFIPGVQRWLKNGWKYASMMALAVAALMFQCWMYWPRSIIVSRPSARALAWVSQNAFTCALSFDNGDEEAFLAEPDPVNDRHHGLPCGHTVESGANASVPLYVGVDKVNYGRVTTHSTSYLGSSVRPIGFTLWVDPRPPNGFTLWQLTGGTKKSCRIHWSARSFVPLYELV